MFESIHIENFRGLKTADISGFRPINLFFGKNNSGKSSVLEAIFLISGQSNPALPLTINNLRNYQRFTENDLALDFYNLQTEREISISADASPSRKLTISPLKSNSKDLPLDRLTEGVSDTAAGYYGLKLTYTLGEDGKDYKSEIIIKQGEETKGRTRIDARYKEKLFSMYLPSSYVQLSVSDKYAKIVENKQEKDILTVLQGIEPKIRDLQLVGNDLLVDIGLPQRLPINVMGDGLRKMLANIIAVYGCRDGILLIDEVDNGFHYSAMKLLWKSLFHAARINNVQLFITTHNIDSLKGLVAFLQEEEDYRDDVAAYNLIKSADDRLETVRYDYSKINYAIEQEMEMR